MDDGATLYTIGQVARRTGLPTKTIRFYSDAGVVPPARRTRAGYRLYDIDALARLELVRTLRELGVDLASIRHLLDRQVTVPELAEIHARTVDAQIQALRLRRAVLRAVAKRGSTPEEMTLMHRLAGLPDHERQRLISDFWDEVFGGLDINPDFEARMRAARPVLPDDPTPEQVDAWVELAVLAQDADFRTRARAMGERHSAEREAGNPMDTPAEEMAQRVHLVVDKASAALDAGVDPASPQARPVADEIAGALAGAPADDRTRADDPAFRAQLADQWELFSDARVERFWQLLAVINGWPPVPTTMPAHEWMIAALRASGSPPGSP
ncbi:MAG: MerR family transcriptional regulator [Carbonactinosporaceae bacterium]